jgi:hypothetical protein
MSDKYFKTQDTDMWFYDPENSTDGVVKLGCVTNISGLGGARSQIDTSCFSDTDDTFVGGRGSPGQVSVDLNYSEDDQNEYHAKLEAAREAGNTLVWAIGFSNGTAPPTVTSSGSLEFPATRSGRVFNGYIADVNFEFPNNDIIRTSLSIQRSGTVQRFKKA